jgi:hypothetical protein
MENESTWTDTSAIGLCYAVECIFAVTHFVKGVGRVECFFNTLWRACRLGPEGTSFGYRFLSVNVSDSARLTSDVIYKSS